MNCRINYFQVILLLGVLLFNSVAKVQACTEPEDLVIDYKFSSEVICLGSSIIVQDLSTCATSRLWTFQDADINTSTDKLVQTTFLSTGLKTITLWVSSDAGFEKEMSIDVLVNEAHEFSCIPADNMSSGGITSFMITDVNNFSGTADNAGSYEDFSCSSIATLVPSMTYQVSIETEGTSYLSVFVDENGDNEFSSEEELVSMETPNDGLQFADLSTTDFPALDAIVRLRVISSDQEITDPCVAPEVGQVEDYGVIYFDDPIDDCLDPVTYYLDNDNDGYGDSNQTYDSCDQLPGYVAQGGDCDDSNAEVYPGASEACDGIDNDCDGNLEELVFNYIDTDGDGWGDASQGIFYFCLSEMPVEGYVEVEGDCDDSNADVYPGASELCDGLDNNCNGTEDEGLEVLTYYADNDNDGYGDSDLNYKGCDQLLGYVLVGGDCNDSDADINPGASEACDGIDNNCDGNLEELVFNYIDADGDGWGDASQGIFYFCLSEMPVEGYVEIEGDCDDSNADVNPDATEVCDGVDNNCDGTMDEGEEVLTYYVDNDNDGYGDNSQSYEGCEHLPGYVLQGGDCDDNNAEINPDAIENCDGIDNNCDGVLEELVFNYVDADGDGWGDASQGIFYFCLSEMPVEGYVEIEGDCDDSNADVNPDATEVCDGVDNNCDGDTDHGAETKTYYFDGDNDGFGDNEISYQGCESMNGYVEQGGDCDDTNDTVYPGASELCDGIDNNCDNNLEELVFNYIDADGDGWGDASQGIYYFCLSEMPVEGYVEVEGDCDDSNADINPDSPEVCDGLDNNCNNMQDEGMDVTTYYFDFDQDGYGSDDASYEGCEQFPGYVTEGGDCNDGNASVYPGAPDYCDNLDNDCDGEVDEDSRILYLDADQDGYGGAYGVNECDIESSAQGFVENNDDCDDLDPTIYPGANELCDGKDNNCDGSIDEGTGPVVTYYLDFDQDGYGSEDASYEGCEQFPGYVTEGGDCDDSNSSVYPGAPDYCDGTDNDCDGEVDEDARTLYLDADLDGYGAGEAYNECDITVSIESYVEINGDCDDYNPDVYPGASELCDGIDNNCDGQLEEVVFNYIDEDGDGWGDASVGTYYFCLSEMPVEGFVELFGDCDDSDAAVNPDAEEICDGVDNNCDGIVDEGCSGEGFAGRSFNDQNGNGLQDPQEEGIAGMLVTLSSAEGRFDPISVMTNADGSYDFEALPDGEYVMEFELEVFDVPERVVAISDDVSTYVEDGMVKTESFYFNPEKFDGAHVGFKEQSSVVLSVDDASAIEARWIEKESKVAIDWAVNIPKNVDYYMIERALDQTTDFQSIGEVIGDDSRYYEFMDETIVESGIYYYRITFQDWNGNVSSTDVVSVKVSFDLTSVSVFPNPTVDVINVKLTEDASDNLSVSLMDTTGKVIDRRTFSSSEEVISFDATGLSTGTYFVQTNNAGSQQTNKVLVIK